MISFDKIQFNNLEHRDRARLINSLAGVKPVNLIGTQNSDGVKNLCIVSSVVHLGADPALFGFVIRPDVVPRDTLDNLRVHPFLTVNHVHEDIVEQAHQTSARYEKGVDEFEKCGLKSEYIDHHPAPFVFSSHIKFAAKFLREIKIEENGTHFLICEITAVYCPKDALDEDYSLNITRSKTVGVSGLDRYLSLKSLGRLSYAKPEKPLKWISSF
ncbi:MAG: flavin oxidoreductase [Halobacteriovoraceae bacterium]|nr:flavin oxidoreductase [Halobacteriovoraceae bacterium]|tara:strand:+ start:6836 stop:7477 length:642 start_codon:yes stop_codon:yes gene_type:complete